MRELELEGGKYRIVREDSGYVAAYRYGEAWRDLTGDKLIGALVSEVEELRQITPADGCVVQQADAWQAVIALLRESGAVNPRTQRNTGKETALAAIRDLVERVNGQWGVVGTVIGGQFHYLHPDHGLGDGTKLYAGPETNNG